MNDNYRTDGDGKDVEEAPKNLKKGVEPPQAAVRPAIATDRKPAFRMTARAQARPPFVAAMGSDDLMSQAQEDDDPAPIADGVAART